MSTNRKTDVFLKKSLSASAENERSGEFPCLFVSEKLNSLAMHDYIKASIDLGGFGESSLLKGFFPIRRTAEPILTAGDNLHDQRRTNLLIRPARTGWRS